MTKSTNELWALIIEYGIATEKELQLVTDVCGTSEDTLNKVIYSRTGYRDIEQYEEEENDEPYDIDNDMGFDPYMGSYSYDC